MKGINSCAAIAAFGLAAIYGAEGATNDVHTLQPVTVYASRIGAAKDSVPAAVSIFTAADIASGGARDLPDLLKRKAGLDIHAMNGNPLLTSIATRGFGDNAFARMKVVLDGEELNNVDMAPPNLTRIPLGAISRVEVIRGPHPVLYGDGAVAGVVNVITDDPDFARKTVVSGLAGSQGTFGGHARTRGGFEESGILYGASYDYLRSDGFRDRSAYYMHTANASVRRLFGNGSSAGVRANWQNAYYELPGSLDHDQWKHHRKSANNLDDDTRIWSGGVGFDSKARLDGDQWLRIDGGLSHQHRHAKMAAWGTDTEYDYDSYAVSPRYVNEEGISGLDNTFTAGVDLRFDGYETDPKSGGDTRFRRSRYAIFAQDSLGLSERVTLEAGVRTERIANKWTKGVATGQTSGHDWMIDGELGIVFRPAKGVKTFARGTRFHRSAFCDELSYTRDGDFLDPETGWSLDAGVEWDISGGFVLDISGWGMVMEDEIFFDPALAPYGFNCNSPGRTRRIGLDAGLSWTREKVCEFSVRYGVVRAEFDSGAYDGCDIPYVPRHRARVEGGFWPAEDLEVKAGCTAVGSQRVSGDFANASDKLSSYALFDIGAYYSPSWAGGWRASFTMDNVFDRNYCDYAGVGYYYPASGRSFLFSVGCEF